MTRRVKLLIILIFSILILEVAYNQINRTHYFNIVCKWPADGDERANRGEVVEYKCEDTTPWYKR